MSRHLEYINGEWQVVDESTGEVKGKKVIPGKTKEPRKEYKEEEQLYCSKIYLSNFTFDDTNSRVYPCNIIAGLDLNTVTFAPVTIFYGGNGSGKSTILNIISEKLGILNKTNGNTNAYFADYVEKCGFEIFTDAVVPDDATFIRSEDIMEAIMKKRRRYDALKKMALAQEKYLPDVDGKIKGITNRFLNHQEAISASERFFLSRCSAAGTMQFADEVADTFLSNGEVAMENYHETIMPDTLYFLDEPETSLSPKFQKELAEMITIFSKGLRTQFIIATYSPFFLSIEGARIYDLDSMPARVKNWWELENMQEYFILFESNRDKFQPHL